MKLRANLANGVVDSYTFWCPGCNSPHSFNVVSPRFAKDVPVWTFNGDMEKPTFSPSLRVFYTHPQTKEQKTICHLFLTDGKLIYQGDSGHDMKGQTVDLPDIPQI